MIHGKGILKEYSLQSLSECWACLSTLLLGRRQFTHDTAFALFTYFIFKCAFCVCYNFNFDLCNNTCVYVYLSSL